MKRGNKTKFGRERNQRTALYKALATALIDNEKIKTTQAKAKALSIFMDRLVSRATNGDLASRKFILQHIGEKSARKLVSEIGPRFKERKGGYTRVTRLGQRGSDGAQMAIVEFVQ